MADKLAAELQLPNVSVLQLHELKWTTKERVWVQLVQRNPSSVQAYERVKALCDDRKQARGVEKAEDLPRDAVRKTEDSYRADFMKVIETELARIGAPSMITWQRLVLDKDCNYQAMRILLTKIKSSQKKQRANTLLPVIELKPPPRTDAPANEPGHEGNIARGAMAAPPPTTSTALPHSRGRSKPSTHEQPETNSPPASPTEERTAPRRPLPPTDTAPRPSWNNVFVDLPQGRESSSLPDVKRIPRSSGQESAATSSVRLQNQAPQEGTAKPSGATAQKLKAALAENAALKKQMQDMVAMHDAAMAAAPDARGGGPSTRRMRLLQAQNLQLQRQVDMLTEAVHLRQHAQEDLAHVVSSLVEIAMEGQRKAAEAGADQTGGKGGELWMFAAPTTLLAELKQVEHRLNQVRRKGSMEVPLRYNADAVHDRNAVLMSDLHRDHASAGPEHVPQLHHLRMDRLHALESALTACASQLDSLCQTLMDRRHDGDLVDVTSRLAAATRAAVEEVALFGSAVCHHAVGPGSKLTSEPRAQDILTRMTVKDKVLAMHLKRLALYEAGRDVQLKSIATELAGYKERAASQADLTSRLLDGVRAMGTEKLTWVQQTLHPALHGLTQVYDQFKAHAADLPKGWASLFCDTFEQHVGTLSRVDAEFQQYAKTVNAKLDNTVQALSTACS